MRAVIAARFAAYTFERIDQLSLDDVVDLYASAIWIGEKEAETMNKGTQK